MLQTPFHTWTHRIKKSITMLLAATTAFSIPLWAAGGAEVPGAVYTGREQVPAILANLDFADVKDTQLWSAEAIYQSGALGVLKGYGSRSFGREDPLSREAAIAIAFRAAGREAEALQMAEQMYSKAGIGQQPADAVRMWSDGYLQLAAKEGLITKQDLADAFATDPTKLGPTSFRRDAPAQRQDMAYWIAKALKLEPVYTPEKIFNNYADWKEADAAKIPYIEAVVRKNIMNGTGEGRFMPRQVLTREQAAQIIKNAEDSMLSAMGYTKGIGTIEAVQKTTDYSQGQNIAKTQFLVRNVSGKLHALTTEALLTGSRNAVGELDGTGQTASGKDFVVYKYGRLGTAAMLAQGDRLEYITDGAGTVLYVRVVSSIYDTRYVVGKLENIQVSASRLEVLQFFEVTSPDVDAVQQYIGSNMSPLEGEKAREVYTWKNGMPVWDGDRKINVSALSPEDYVIITLHNGLATELHRVDISALIGTESGIVKGIVEENNPKLGYISLYNEDGTGGVPAGGKDISYRTFNYVNQAAVEVLRNHEKASIEDIEPGDTVFMKLDARGNLVSVSAIENYVVQYGKIISVQPQALSVKLDDGSYRVLTPAQNIWVLSGRKVVDYANLKDGDYVRLTLQTTPSLTRVKEIVIQGDEHFITTIYKGTVSDMNTLSDKLVVQNLEMFDRGRWTVADQKAFASLPLAGEYSIYVNDRRVSLAEARKYLTGTQAYIAVEKDMGGNEKAVMISFRDEERKEQIYDDSIGKVTAGAGSFTLNQNYNTIYYGEGTIIVKHGRLVSGVSISGRDEAYVVANRDSGSGKFQAGVLQIDEKMPQGTWEVYRGRIKQVNEGRDFTVESFAKLDGIQWKFTNTPKTFNLMYDTLIVDTAGVVNTRDFNDYGATGYKSKVVYILSDGIDAKVVSTAPYGTANIKGSIYSVEGGSYDDDGKVINEPTTLRLTDAVYYDTASYMWKSSAEMTLQLLKNTVILKGDKLLRPSELHKSDTLRVIKVDTAASGDAYLIFVEK